jgi:hypothetical protein
VSSLLLVLGWNINGTSMEYLWNIYGISMEYLWNILAPLMHHPPMCLPSAMLYGREKDGIKTFMNGIVLT